MVRKLTIVFSVLFLLGWFIIFVDEPLRYPANGKTFLSLFQRPSTWIFIIYLLFAEFIVLTAVTGSKGVRFLLLSLAVLLPFLYFMQEYLAEVIYCSSFFCGDVYPPTTLSYIGGGLVSSAIVLKFGLLAHQIKKNRLSKPSEVG